MLGFGWLAHRLMLVALLAGALAVGAPGSAAAALPSNCSQSGTAVTCTFSYSAPGGPQSWTPPAGVTSVTVDAFGAQGGGTGIGDGGAGGEVTGALAVTPGQPIEVVVGGQGGNIASGTAGFNGGGAGGAAGYTAPPALVSASTGAGGGGASDVRTGDCAQTLSCGLSARVLVAGGGGGSVDNHGYSGFDGAGGGGGNPDGIEGQSAGNGNGGGGGGGTQSIGGAIGAAASASDCDSGNPMAGNTGSLGAGGTGGTGGDEGDTGEDGGSGGGGGYYGGGGGGGAGCDFNTGASGAGGGGSSYGPDGATFTNAIHDGAGQVTISYTVDEDLALSGVPANITTPATGPNGAVVTYTAPTATDEGSEAPSVSCDPASGSTFAVGATTVTCTATDNDDANSPVSAQFTVTVYGALAQLQGLLAYVNGLPPGTSLQDKATEAIDYYNAGDTGDTCSTLAALITEATAQRGKHLTVAQANPLIADAGRIRAVIDC